MNQLAAKNEALKRSKQAPVKLRDEKQIPQTALIAFFEARALPCPDTIFSTCRQSSSDLVRDVYGILTSGLSSINARLGREFAFEYLKGGDAEAGAR